MIPLPITFWYSNLGVGDGQDMATRGYLRSLLAVDFKYVVAAPKASHLMYLDDPEIKDLSQLSGYPKEMSVTLKRVEKGDPRIGQKWPHIEEDTIAIPASSHSPNSEGVSWKNEITEGEVDQTYYLEHPEERHSPYTPVTERVVLHFDPGQLARGRDVLGRESDGQVPIIGITAWEADKVPAAIAQQLSDLDLLIVPSYHTAEAFRRSGLDPDCPIQVVPHALDMAPLSSEEASLAMNAPRNRYVFYTIGTNIARKNLTALIAAYCKAFGPNYENVGLVIKTSGDSESLRALYRDGINLAGGRYSPKVALYGDRWSDAKIRALHLQCNCWVDMTRGEGFGLGQQAAAAMGNPVITTGWGAQTEVLEGSGIMRSFIDYTLTGVDPTMAAIGVYQEDQQWAEPSIEAMVDAMRRAAMERWSKSLAQANKVADKYSMKRVGKVLASALQSAKVML